MPRDTDLAEATIAFALMMPEARQWDDREGGSVTLARLAELLIDQ
ncbi:MAG: hypothetical protein WCJ09_11380 [Planctomycetota bacterium]